MNKKAAGRSVSHGKPVQVPRTFEVQALEGRIYLSSTAITHHTVTHSPQDAGYRINLEIAGQYAASVLARSSLSATVPTLPHNIQAQPKTKPAHNPKPRTNASSHHSAAKKGGSHSARSGSGNSRGTNVLQAQSAASTSTLQVGASTIPSISDPLYSIVVQKDGKIVVLGAHNGTFSALRYDTTGQLDKTFGTNGSAVVTFTSGQDAAHTIAIDYAGTAKTNKEYGKIVVAGGSAGGFVIARLNPNGGLDSTFGVGGKVSGVLAGGTANGLILKSDGSILVGGTDAKMQPVVIRLSSRGVLDQSFGSGGVYQGALTSLKAGSTTATVSTAAITPNVRRRGGGVLHPFSCSGCGGCGGCGSCNPSYSAPNVSFSNSPYNSIEGATFTAGGSISDPNPNESLSATVNYGDGTGDQTLDIDGSGNFSLSHVYAEDANYTINISVTDSNDNEQGGASASVSVAEVAPTFVSSPGNSIASTANPFALYVTTDDSSSDPDPVQSINVVWGDGTNNTYNASDYGGTLPNPFPAQHTYSTFGTFSASASAGDDGSQTSSTVQVLPVSPTISGAYQVQAGTTYTLSLPQPFDTAHSVQWTLNWGDGTVPQVINGNPSTVTHTFQVPTISDVITATAVQNGITYTSNRLPIVVRPGATADPPTTNVTINFQPLSYTMGDSNNYLPDTGLVFADRSSFNFNQTAYCYGWDNDQLSSAVDATGGNTSLDFRNYTWVPMQQHQNGITTNNTWSIGLANGSYKVRIVSGNPSFTSGTYYQILANGTTVVNGAPSSSAPWVDASATVSVANGRLTLTNGPLAVNNIINFIEITPAAHVSTIPNAPSGLSAQAESALSGGNPVYRVNLNWVDNSDNETGFTVYRSTDGTNFSSIGTLTPNADFYSDTTVASGTTYYYRVKANNSGAGDSSYSNTAQVTTLSSTTEAAYGGTAWTVPGKIESENFDTGSGAYFDGTAPNLGGQYRNTPINVDLGSSVPGGGFAIGWTAQGEWTNYSINVNSSTTYRIDLSVASAGPGGSLDLYLDDPTHSVQSKRLASMPVPDTGGWNTYETISREGISLSAGAHVLSLYVSGQNADDQAAGNIDWMRFTSTAQAAPSAPENLTAKMNTGGPILLNWQDFSTNATSYTVQHSTDNGQSFQTLVSGLASSATQYSDSGSTAGAVYVYRVVAVNAQGTSDPTNTVIVVSSDSGSVTVAPTADTYVDASDNSPHGSSLALDAHYGTANGSKDQKIFLKFDLSSVTGTISGAKLRLFGREDTGNQTGITTDVSGISDTTWTESGATWTNQPSGTPAMISTQTVDELEGRWYDWDITPYVLQQLSAGHTTITLEVDSTVTSAGYLTFDSRDATASKPVLLVSRQSPPAAPTLSASVPNNSTSQVNLSWTFTGSASSFGVERSTDGVNFTQIATAPASPFSYSDTGLTVGTQYYYRVRANGSPYGESAYSSTVPATTAPGEPTGLTAVTISSNEIDLSWANAPGVQTSVYVEKSTDGTHFDTPVQLASNATSYHAQGLTPGTQYTFHVYAVNSGGSSVKATTSALSVPAAPTNFAATVVSSSEIDLAWTNGTGIQTALYVQISTDNVNFGTPIQLSPSATTYHAMGLTTNTIYYFRIYASNASGNSSYATTSSATTFAAPTNLTATADNSEHRIHLAWTDNTSDETGFEIDRSTSPDTGFAALATVGRNVTTFDDLLDPDATTKNPPTDAGTTYYYEIIAIKNTLRSDPSNVAHAALSQTVSGFLFNDTNRNGVWDSNFIQGSRPQVVFLIDVSDSTGTQFGGDLKVGDLNGDRQANTRLDAEIAGYIALNEELIHLGFGSTALVTVQPFCESDVQLPSYSSQPSQDINGDGIPDVEANLMAQQHIGETDYKSAFDQAYSSLIHNGALPGNANIVFLSDGVPYDVNPDDPSDFVDQLREMTQGPLRVNIQAFGDGPDIGDSGLQILKLINPNATVFNTPDELLGTFSRLIADQSGEGTVAGQQVYLDLNNNQQYDAGEPIATTDSTGWYSLPVSGAGTYHVAKLPVSGWLDTTPTIQAVPVTTGQAVDNIDFGTVENDEAAPTANFTASDTSPYEGSRVNFSFSNVQGSGPFRYSYDFDDEDPGDPTFTGPDDIQNSVSPIASFVYPDNGIHTVIARVYDAYGKYTQYTQFITVQNAIPSAHILGLPPQIDLADTHSLLLNASVFDPGLTDSSVGFNVLWSVTQDGVAGHQDTNSQDHAHGYPFVLNFFTPGTYRVTLTATDKDGGRSDPDVEILQVTQSTPWFVSQPTATVSADGTKVNLNVVADDDQGEANLTYTWSGTPIDDVLGFTKTGTHDASSTTAYIDRAQSYSFTVTATDAQGNQSTISVPVVVPQIPSSVVLTPPIFEVAADGSQSISATVNDQFNVSITGATPTFSLTTNASGGSITGAGAYTAGSVVGAADVIEATDGNVSATAVALVGSSGTSIVGTAATGLPAVEGTVTSNQYSLAEFYDPGGVDASNYSATIDWGDGQTGTANVFNLATHLYLVGDATHTYTKPGTFTFTVTLTGNSKTGTATGTYIVRPATLVGGGLTVDAIMGQPFSGTLATFTDTYADPNSPKTAADFTAQIDWGDGRIDAGTVSLTDGKFAIAGSHTFTAVGKDSISISITEDGQPVATVPAVANVQRDQAPAPTGFNAIAISSSQIYLYWDINPDVLGYIVTATDNNGATHRLPTETDEYFHPTVTQENRHSVDATWDQNLPVSTQYTYSIQAVYPDGTISPPSDDTPSATTWATAAVPMPVGLTGTNIYAVDRVTNKGGSGVQLFWSPDTKVDGYKVFRQDAQGVWQDLIGQNPDQSERYLDPTTLVDGKEAWFDSTADYSSGITQYNYKVIAYKMVTGQVDPSASSPALVTVSQDTQGPSQPTGLKAASFPEGIQLTWNDRPVTDDLDFAGWNVYRQNPTTGDWVKLTPLPINDVTGYNDTNAPIGQTSNYEVKAVDLLTHESTPATISYRRSIHGQPPAPTGLFGRADGSGAILLDWDDVTPTLDNGWAGDALHGYNIYRRVSDTDPWTSLGQVTSSTYRDTGLSNSTSYQYQVIAVDGDGDTSDPATVTAQTGDGVAPATPVLVSGTALSTSEIELVWVAGSGGDGQNNYSIYRSEDATSGFTFVTSVTAAAGAGSNTYDDLGLAVGTTYYYRIYASDMDGDFSLTPLSVNVQTQTVPEAPPFLSITPLVDLTGNSTRQIQGDSSDGEDPSSPGGSLPTNSGPMVISADTPVRGIVDDPNNNLTDWTLVLRPMSATGTPADIVVASGTQEVGQAPDIDAPMGIIQATMVPDGLYQLVLKSDDPARHDGPGGSHQELLGQEVQIHTNVKVGNFTTSATDMSIDVPGGQSLVVRRVYDSSTADTSYDFGPGWKLDVSDTGLRTTSYAGNRGSSTSPAMRSGDLVYITIPGGWQEAFEFVPVPDGYDPGNPGGAFGAYFTYYPQFIAVDGSGSRLTVMGDVSHENPNDRIQLTRDGDEFYGNTDNGQEGYNPARLDFGGQYTLTTQDGTVYQINASDGNLMSTTDANGNSTSFDSGTVTSGEWQLTIHHDDQGRIDWIGTNPDGTGPRVLYTYDPITGNLISVTDRDGNTTHYSYNAGTTPGKTHLLTGITDGQGDTVETVSYDPLGKVEAVTDAKSNKATLNYGGYNGTQGETGAADPLGGTTQEIYDSYGNVIRSIQAVNDPVTGVVQKYIVTVSEYDYPNVDGQDPLVSGVTNMNHLGRERHWQPFELQGPDDAGLRFTLVPGDSQFTASLASDTLYKNSEGDRTDATNPDLWMPTETITYAADGTPRTTFFENFSQPGDPDYGLPEYVHGKPRYVKDPWGNITHNVYDADGNVTSTTVLYGTPQAQTTYFTYTPGSVNDGTYTYINGLTVSYDDIPAGLPVESYRYAADGTTKVLLSSNLYYTEGPAAQKGKVRASTDAAGLVTLYFYDDNGNTIKTQRQWTDAQGQHTPTDTLATYDNNGQELTSTDGNNQTTRTIYDANGQTLISVDPYGGQTINAYNADGQVVQTLYPDGTEERTAYDALGRPVWQTNRFASTSSRDIDLDTLALISQTIDSTATATLTHTLYDSAGRTIGTETYVGVNITLSQGSSALELESALPTLTPASSHFLSSTATYYDDFGRVVESRDATGLRTGTLYYPNGQVQYTGVLSSDTNVAPIGGPFTTASFVSYTESKYEQTDSLPAGAINYNASILHFTRNGVAVMQTTKTYMDALGRSIMTVYDDGSFTETLYSNNDIAVTRADLTQPTSAEGWPGTGTGNTTLPHGYTEKIEIAQRKTGDTPLATYYLYDVSGKLVDVWQPAVVDADPNSLTHNSTLHPHWHYTYDINGNELTETDPKNNTTSFTYDEQNRELSRTLPDLQKESFAYDNFGNEATHTDFVGNVATSSYYTEADDPKHAGMLKSVTYTGPGQTAYTIIYSYDNYGRKSQVIDPVDLTSSNGTTTYHYDESGGEVTIDPNTGAMTPVSGNFGELTSVASPQGTVHYVYDAVTGRLVETWTGTGADDTTSTTETLYGYDSQGRLASVTTARENEAAVTPAVSGTRYDAVGHTIGTTLPTTLYIYDGAGELLQQINPNNTETDYDYTNLWNPAGGQEIVTNKRTSDGKVLSEFTYTFNAQRQKISELDQMTDAGEGASNSQLYTWQYDADGRLTDETFDNQNDAPDGTTNAVTTDDYHDHYDYDLNGNRLDEKIDAKDDGGSGPSAVYDQVTNYLYNGNNELTTETQTTVATGTTVYSTTYLYDDNGSLKQSTRTDATSTAITTYTYDARNRILTVASNGSSTAYTYDDSGMLVQQATTVSGTTDTTTFLIDANNPTGYSQVLEVRKNGSRTITYTLGKSIIAQNSGGTISYIMPDGHGSTRQLTTFTGVAATNGHVAARYDYDAFGSPIGLTATAHAANSVSTSVLYVGMLLDSITGNYRTETREYTAADGRFFAQDTYMPAAGDTGNGNLYVYAAGNPITQDDPTGNALNSDEQLVVNFISACVLGMVLSSALKNATLSSMSFSRGNTPQGLRYLRGEVQDLISLGIGGEGASIDPEPLLAADTVTRMGAFNAQAAITLAGDFLESFSSAIASFRGWKYVKRPGAPEKDVTDAQGNDVRVIGQSKSTSGTTGHDQMIDKLVEQELTKPGRIVISMQRALRTLTGRTIRSRSIPDVMVVRIDQDNEFKIDMYEVQSDGQTERELRLKLDELKKLIPVNMQGETDVVKPQP